MSIEAWETQYRPRINHLDPHASWTCGEGDKGCLFETYGNELQFVEQQDPRTVWTLVAADGDGKEVILSGLHRVNRLGHFVAQVPRTGDEEIIVSSVTRSDSDLDRLGETLADMRCSHSMLLGEILHPMVPDRFKDQAVAGILCAGALFLFDVAGRFVGTSANPPALPEENHGKRIPADTQAR